MTNELHRIDPSAKIPACTASQETDLPCTPAFVDRLARTKAKRSLARKPLGHVLERGVTNAGIIANGLL